MDLKKLGLQIPNLDDSALRAFKLLEQQQLLSAGQAGTLAPLLGKLEEQFRILKGGIGPLSDLQKFGAFDSVVKSQQNSWDKVSGGITAHKPQFIVPHKEQLDALFGKLRATIVPKNFPIESSFDQIGRALESMNQPWLKLGEEAKSILAVTKLQGIGLAINSLQPFGNELATILRSGLGDWREQITWPSEIFTDIAARSQFYLDLGLDQNLVDFPNLAFEQSLNLSRDTSLRPTLDDEYSNREIPLTDTPIDNNELDSQRASGAYNTIQRFECLLRKFIDCLMTREFGVDWHRHRLPNGLHDAWKEKEEKARKQNEREHPLIAYAEFTDYIRIIQRSDNWKNVFSKIFIRLEDVRESLQRLYPVRNCTMHSRTLSNEDEMLLEFETRRITRFIGSFNEFN